MLLTLITSDHLKIPFDQHIACQIFHLIDDLIIDTQGDEVYVDFTYDEWREFFLIICGTPPEPLNISLTRLAYITEYLDLTTIYRPIITNLLVSSLVPKYLIKNELTIQDFLSSPRLQIKIKPRCQYIERSRRCRDKQCQDEASKGGDYCQTHTWFTSFLQRR